MSHAAVYAAIADSTELHDLGFLAVEVYRTTGMENTQSDKYIVLRWGDTTPGVGESGPEDLTVWAYDKIGSYADIDKVLYLIKSTLTAMVQVDGSDGRTTTQVAWEGFSSDLYDDALKRITRNALFTVNSRVS